MALTPATGSDWSLDAGTLNQVAYVNAGAQTQGPHSTAFLVVLSGSWPEMEQLALKLMFILDYGIIGRVLANYTKLLVPMEAFLKCIPEFVDKLLIGIGKVSLTTKN